MIFKNKLFEFTTKEMITQQAIDDFISDLSCEYNINSSELKNLWLKKTEMKRVSNIPHELEITIENVTTATKTTLSAMCKYYKLKLSGKKSDLVERLLNYKKSMDVRDKLRIAAFQDQDLQVISRNKFGNYEDKDTHFIFDVSTKNVIGKQEENGSISILSKEDIFVCKEKRFSYVLPDNLDLQGKENMIVEEIIDGDEMSGSESDIISEIEEEEDDEVYSEEEDDISE